MAILEHSSTTQDMNAGESSQAPYDLVVVGFGPAQLAIAIALQESRSKANVVFLERDRQFTWHPESHLPRTRMEHAFVYDLATTRNPRSNYTYLQYLHAKNRLVDFANMSYLKPLREEFEDYLKWAARQFRESVVYGSEVVGVTPVREAESPIRQWRIKVRDLTSGNHYNVQTRNIVVPTSKNWPLPVSFLPSSNSGSIISTEEYLTRRDELRMPRDPPIDVSVVGSSDQAVEIVDDLVSCPKLGNITFVTRNEALKSVKQLEESTTPSQERPLCSIWGQKQTSNETASPVHPSEVIDHIYYAAYEKRVASKGKYKLRVLLGEDAADPSVKSDITILERADSILPRNGLWSEVDPLVLAARQKGQSLEEIQFKRGTVAEQSKIWVISASEGSSKDGGRSLAPDIAVKAGEIVKTLSDGLGKTAEPLLVNPRI